jgi:hypothetical protein
MAFIHRGALGFREPGPAKGEKFENSNHRMKYNPFPETGTERICYRG